MSDSPYVQIACPHCKTIYKVPVEKVPDGDVQVTCKKCGKKFPIRYILTGSKSIKISPSSTRKPILTCPKCGNKQNRAGKCQKCGASMGMRIIIQNGPSGIPGSK